MLENPRYAQFCDEITSSRHKSICSTPSHWSEILRVNLAGLRVDENRSVPVGDDFHSDLQFFELLWMSSHRRLRVPRYKAAIYLYFRAIRLPGDSTSPSPSSS